jgi:hypothetical protein
VFGPIDPLQVKVKDVCERCNTGWMSRLEASARPILTPIILGTSVTLRVTDQPVLAAWVLKTSLVTMLVSSADQRAAGYGVPASEFADLYAYRDKKRPPKYVQVWLGHYEGEQLLHSTQTTPMVVTARGLPPPPYPQGYVFSILLGKAFICGVRFTTPSLQIHLLPVQGFAQIWPVKGEVTWPKGDPVDDLTLRATQKGLTLQPIKPDVQFLPFGPAVDLPRGEVVRTAISSLAPCGLHEVFYPLALVDEAQRGRFYLFVVPCECGKAYLVRTETDGAHFKAEGPPDVIEATYEAASGEEWYVKDETGAFLCKRVKLSDPVPMPLASSNQAKSVVRDSSL